MVWHGPTSDGIAGSIVQAMATKNKHEVSMHPCLTPDSTTEMLEMRFFELLYPFLSKIKVLFPTFAFMSPMMTSVP